MLENLNPPCKVGAKVEGPKNNYTTARQIFFNAVFFLNLCVFFIFYLAGFVSTFASFFLNRQLLRQLSHQLLRQLLHQTFPIFHFSQFFLFFFQFSFFGFCESQTARVQLFLSHSSSDASDLMRVILAQGAHAHQAKHVTLLDLKWEGSRVLSFSRTTTLPL